MTEIVTKFQPGDSTAKAMKLTEEMRSIADSLGLYDYVCAENPTPLIEVVDMSVVTEANSAKMTLLDKKQVEQAKAMAKVKMEYMKIISEEALDTAVIQEGIPLEATIDARDIYLIMRATYCVTSDAVYRKNVRDMREEWKEGKSLTNHIKKHMTARMQVNTQKAAKGITADTNTTCVEELDLTLHELNHANTYKTAWNNLKRNFLDAEDQTFSKWAAILMRAARDGEFGDEKKDDKPEEVNAITSGATSNDVIVQKILEALKKKTASGKGRDTKEDFAERSAKAKAKHAMHSVHSACPVHKPNEHTGASHTWGECFLYTGVIVKKDK